MGQFEIIRYPLSGEKTIRMMEAHNKLIFAVKQSATKPQIKGAIQDMFRAKVTCVHTKITPRGEKQAIVTFAKETPAIDIATTLGLM
ncbi:MAG: 50S ribosomal protein L23 [Candidatus Aenigmarchaeota archaeon]|nr:50S ribosomal protein L23 [Candidatus Aenigmarchaeota archaeon]